MRTPSVVPVRFGQHAACGQGTVVCPATDMLHSCATLREPIWFSWIGSKSILRARSPPGKSGSSDPVSFDLLPESCLSSKPHRPGHPHITLSRANPWRALRKNRRVGPGLFSTCPCPTTRDVLVDALSNDRQGAFQPGRLETRIDHPTRE